jgi:hypothetical protein
MEAESKSASGQRRSDLRLCFRLFLRCPPRFHQRRQLLPHGCTQWLATSGLLGNSSTLLGPRFAFLLCPPGLLCRSDSGTCCRAHTSTSPATRWLSQAPLLTSETQGKASTRSTDCITSRLGVHPPYGRDPIAALGSDDEPKSPFNNWKIRVGWLKRESQDPNYGVTWKTIPAPYVPPCAVP